MADDVLGGAAEQDADRPVRPWVAITIKSTPRFLAF
jgi:hypothetical protein